MVRLTPSILGWLERCERGLVLAYRGIKGAVTPALLRGISAHEGMSALIQETILHPSHPFEDRVRDSIIVVRRTFAGFTAVQWGTQKPDAYLNKTLEVFACCAKTTREFHDWIVMAESSRVIPLDKDTVLSCRIDAIARSKRPVTVSGTTEEIPTGSLLVFEYKFMSQIEPVSLSLSAQALSYPIGFETPFIVFFVTSGGKIPATEMFVLKKDASTARAELIKRAARAKAIILKREDELSGGRCVGCSYQTVCSAASAGVFGKKGV